MRYANVIIDIAHEKVDRVFQYQIPEELSVEVGQCVYVPFGRSDSRRTAYVVELTEESSFAPERIKTIIGVDTTELGVDGQLIRLAWWLKENYGGTMYQALRMVLPVKAKIQLRAAYQVRLLRPELAADRHEEYLRKRQYGKARALSALLQSPILPKEVLTGEWRIAVTSLKALEREQVIVIEEAKPPKQELQTPPPLTSEQQYAVDQILSAAENGQTALLQGVTGSGKTRVYIELIGRILEEGKQAILLVPEIGLTYMLIKQFKDIFGDRVASIHSRMSAGERFREFERARNGQADIMIGPRSALFTPFSKLGLMILDEEHDESYKSELTPMYHTRETAIARATMEGAKVLLASATPSVESYYMAVHGSYKLVEMKKRVMERSLPQISLVDMREELKNGNRSLFSQQALSAITDCLKREEQVILFLNRRGYTGFIHCRSCGHVLKCPNCDVSLHEHNNGTMQCHYCGFVMPSLHVCPQCGSKSFGGFYGGTQKVEEIVERYFPEARVLRLDNDVAAAKGRQAVVIEDFLNHRADILIGTQMIAKGHDFPGVTLVCALAADMSLHGGGYRSGERTFQMLTQVAGRAGRGDRPGQVLIQTYQPEHYALTAVKVSDYQEFYNQEIMYRGLLGYPPVGHLLAVRLRGEEQEQARIASEYMGRLCHAAKIDGVQVIGPTDETIARINQVYRRILYIKHADYRILVRLKDLMEEYVRLNKGFDRLQVQYDFDPLR
ncbi:MAG: primosomal protein N' [Lachnospiraceae bacterium]|nr:primosomal protein N' [Lachnospiraceae bacterium]MDY5742628.1 primosomal protein N' [Lachnospiraceae bacterium]